MQTKISVVVLSYNSSDTVIETLDSILNQKKGEFGVELIISDDCSSDNTISIIEEWLELNENFFSSVVFNKNKNNLGISSHCNLAWELASGEWIKTIAADDILDENCLIEFNEFSKVNPNASIIFSKLTPFSGEKLYPVRPSSEQLDRIDLSVERQLALFYTEPSFFPSPAAYIRNNTLKSIGYGDTRYRNMEDIPLWFKFLSNGHKIYFIDKSLVKYRIGESQSKSKSYMYSLNNLSEMLAFYSENIFTENRSVRLRLIFLIKYICVIFGNKPSSFNRFMSRAMLVFYPQRLIHEVIKRYGKKNN